MTDPPLAWLETADGGLLALRPGRVLAARVVAVAPGRATVSVAGALLDVAADVPLVPGATARLAVHGVDPGGRRVALRLVADDAGPTRTGGIDVSV